MSSFGTLIGIGIIGLGAIFIIPRVLESSTDKQKREQEEKKRGEKGAIANTLDFTFGEGFASKIGLSNVIPDLDNFNQQRKEKEQIVKESGLSENTYDIITDPNRDLTKFNPSGVVGYGYEIINKGKGVGIDTELGMKIIEAENAKRKRFKSATSESLFNVKLIDIFGVQK